MFPALSVVSDPTKAMNIQSSVLRPAALLTLILAGVAHPVRANSVIARWTFETSPPDDLPNSTAITGIFADVGAGTASGFHSAAGTDWSTPQGNGSANSLSANTWSVGDYFQFQVSTLAYSSGHLVISWDQTSSGTGPRDFALRYSTDGISYAPLGIAYSVLENGTPNPQWNGSNAQAIYSFVRTTEGVSGGLLGEPTLFLRLVNTTTVSANVGTVGTAGTGRIDNFTVTAVPETAASAWLVGLGFAGFAYVRRRRR